MTIQTFVQPYREMQEGAPRSVSRNDNVRVDQNIGHAISNTSNTTASTVSQRMPVAKPTRRQVQRQRKKCWKKEQQEPRRDVLPCDTEGSSKDNTSTLTKVLDSIGRKAITRAWSKANLEFEVQVLVWQSMPRHREAAFDFAAGDGVEAQAFSSIKLLLSRFAEDSSVPSEWIVGAKWMEVLTHAMCRSLLDLVEAQKYATRLSKIPALVLSTGAIAENAATNGTTCEKQEIDAFVASVAKPEDAFLVRATVLTLPTETRESKPCSKNVPCKSESLSQREPAHKVRVKNTFLELDSSDSDASEMSSLNHSRSGSSLRCRSAPASRCSSQQCSDQGSDVEKLVRR